MLLRVRRYHIVINDIIIIIGFVLFILRDIPDSCPLVMESALKMLGNFLTHWKAVLINEQAAKVDSHCCYISVLVVYTLCV